MPENIPLDSDLIDVLASETRRNILGQLQDRRMTTTELAEALDLGKATIHEHLNKLSDAGLVQRDDDDRLWVYYELTPKGKRILSPDRTRMYLAIVSFVAAGAIVALAVFAWSATGGDEVREQPSVEEATGADAGPLVVLEEQQTYASGGISLSARGDVNDVDAYLVDQQAAERIRQGDLGVRGLPLKASERDVSTTATSDGTVLTSDASLEPGTYYLYVQAATGDNAERMPTVRLTGIDVETEHPRFYQGVDAGPWTAEVTRGGEPVDGELRLTPEQGTTSVTVPIVDGAVRIHAERLDRLDPGTYSITVEPVDERQRVRTDVALDLAVPGLAAEPLHAREGTNTTVDVHVDGPERLLEAPLSVLGDATTSVRSTDGGWQVNLTAPDPGRVTIDLSRERVGTVQTHPSIDVNATVRDGPQVDWTVRHPSGSPIEDAAVYLDQRSVGVTNATGQVSSPLPGEGEHRLTVHRPDGHTVHRSLRVDGWTIQQTSPRVNVEPVDVASQPGKTVVTTNVSNARTVPQPVTVLGRVDGQTVASATSLLPGGETVQIDLSLPTQPGATRSRRPRSRSNPARLPTKTPPPRPPTNRPRAATAERQPKTPTATACRMPTTSAPIVPDRWTTRAVRRAWPSRWATRRVRWTPRPRPRTPRARARWSRSRRRPTTSPTIRTPGRTAGRGPRRRPSPRSGSWSCCLRQARWSLGPETVNPTRGFGLVRGTEAGKRLVYLAVPFLGFGLLLALSPPVTTGLGERELATVRTLGWVMTAGTLSALAFAGYLFWRGDERIV
jgi:DNA-binding transcriptional ArsR family regulator